jgi:hypothetical protein
VRTVVYDAHSSDRGFFAKGVSVWWRNGSENLFTRITLDWSGNSLWRGEIPMQTSGGVIEYYITARDFAGNLATSATMSFEYLAPCQGDFVSADTFQPPGDGNVDAADLAFLLGEWGRNPGSPADMVSSKTFQPPPDGMVDAADLAFLLGSWGTCE